MDPKNDNHVYCSLREADIFRHTSYLINENKSVSAACRAQLYDLQELIKYCISETRNVYVDPSNNAYHKITFETTQRLLSSFVGYVENSETVDWSKAGIPMTVRPLDIINDSSACWAGLLDFNDFLSEVQLDFKKKFLEQSTFAKPSSRFPLIRASLTITCLLYDLFEVQKTSLSQQLANGSAESLQPPDYIPKAADSFHFNSIDETRSINGYSDTNSIHTLNNSNSMNRLNGNAGLRSAQSSPVLNKISPSFTTNNSPPLSVEKIMTNLDHLRPLFFDWTSIHFAGITNFMRMWQASTAEIVDFDNIEEVMKILFEKATQNALSASSSSPIESVIQRLNTVSYADIRSSQLKLIENKLNDKWGDEIKALYRQYLKEATDFVREQRLRLLLDGDWFFVEDPTLSLLSSSTKASALAQQRQINGNFNGTANSSSRRYFIALSPSRKTLQYSQFLQKADEPPTSDLLTRSIDLSAVSKVNVTQITTAAPNNPKGLKRVTIASRTNITKISLIGGSGSRDGATLSFYSDTPEKASAWGDGLLMLKNRTYQSPDTKKYIEMFAETKLRIQMLNLSPSDLDFENIKSNTKPDLSRLDFNDVSPNFFYS